MSLSRHLTIVGSATLLSRVTGFVRDVLIAAILGTSSIADVYVAAFLIPNLVRRMMSEGALNAAIVPRLARIEQEGGRPALRAYSEDLLSLISVAAFVLVILAELFMPAIMSLVAHGFAADAKKSANAVLFGRIAFPFVGLTLVVALLSTLLNARERFAIAALVPVILNLALIAVMIFLLTTLHVGQFQAGLILVSTVVAAGIIQLVLLWLVAVRAGVAVLPRPQDVLAGRIDVDARGALLLALPGMLIAGSGHVHMIIASLFASFEPRGVSLLYFADRLFQLPLGFVASAIGVVLLPRIARAMQQQDGAAIASAQSESLSFAALLILPSAAGLLVLAEPIIAVLFERAAFTAEDSAAAAANLRVLACALPAFVVVKIILPTFLARERMSLPLAAVGVALLVNVATVLAAGARLGLLAPVIGVAAGAWANALILMVAVHGRFELAARALRRLAAAAAAAFAMALVVSWLAGLAAPWLQPDLPIVWKGGALVALCLAGGAVFLAMALLLRAIDPSMIAPARARIAGRSGR